ncbi:MAG: nucleoside-triphosphatase [Methanocorpusculum sp.]|nr:nucleoside-triphosphatase [Methanocorpusculum sp.]
MKKHIFLTGDIRIGKSTVISKAVLMLNVTPGGFRTAGANFKEDGSSDVMLYPAEMRPEDGQKAAHRMPDKREAYPEIFDTYGSSLLRRPAKLILMDELGFLESDAKTFQQTVLEILNGTTPVLGVIRNKKTEFLDAVRTRDDIILLTVTKENRDFIPEKIVYFMSGKV